MYDRFDSRKGRYVTYDYETKGDRFTRGLSESPLILATVTRYESGRVFKRRVRTNALPSVSVTEMFPGKVLKAFKELTEQGENEIYLSFKDDRLQVEFDPPGTRVGLELSEQYKGKRLWFVCPGCGRRVSRLYVHKGKYLNLWGCQKCFGLSYPSQFAHKSKALDMAILDKKVKVNFRAWLRAHERELRRWGKVAAWLDTLGRK